MQTVRRAGSLLSVVFVGALGCKGSDSATVPAAPASGAAASTLSVAAATASPPPTLLPRGEKAPAFQLEGSDGKTHALADHTGKQAVVIAWFPKAFTGG